MRGTLKKLLVCILSAAMVIGLIGTTAFATPKQVDITDTVAILNRTGNYEYYASLADAVEAAAEGDIIVIRDEAVGVVVDKKITITIGTEDGGGKITGELIAGAGLWKKTLDAETWTFVDQIYNADFVWTKTDEFDGDGIPIYTCDVVLVNKNDADDTKTVEADVEVVYNSASEDGEGETVYVATATADDGEEFSDTKVVTGTFGHDWVYVEDSIAWTNQHTAAAGGERKATIEIECARCGEKKTLLVVPQQVGEFQEGTCVYRVYTNFAVESPVYNYNDGKTYNVSGLDDAVLYLEESGSYLEEDHLFIPKSIQYRTADGEWTADITKADGIPREVTYRIISVCADCGKTDRSITGTTTPESDDHEECGATVYTYETSVQYKTNRKGELDTKVFEDKYADGCGTQDEVQDGDTTHVKSMTIKSEATCTDDTKYTYTCSECGLTFVDYAYAKDDNGNIAAVKDHLTHQFPLSVITTDNDGVNMRQSIAVYRAKDSLRLNGNFIDQRGNSGNVGELDPAYEVYDYINLKALSKETAPKCCLDENGQSIGGKTLYYFICADCGEKVYVKYDDTAETIEEAVYTFSHSNWSNAEQEYEFKTVKISGKSVDTLVITTYEVCTVCGAATREIKYFEATAAQLGLTKSSLKEDGLKVVTLGSDDVIAAAYSEDVFGNIYAEIYGIVGVNAARGSEATCTSYASTVYDINDDCAYFSDYSLSDLVDALEELTDSDEINGTIEIDETISQNISGETYGDHPANKLSYVKNADGNYYTFAKDGQTASVKIECSACGAVEYESMITELDSIESDGGKITYAVYNSDISDMDQPETYNVYDLSIFRIVSDITGTSAVIIGSGASRTVSTNPTNADPFKLVVPSSYAAGKNEVSVVLNPNYNPARNGFVEAVGGTLKGSRYINLTFDGEAAINAAGGLASVGDSLETAVYDGQSHTIAYIEKNPLRQITYAVLPVKTAASTIARTNKLTETAAVVKNAGTYKLYYQFDLYGRIEELCTITVAKSELTISIGSLTGGTAQTMWLNGTSAVDTSNGQSTNLTGWFKVYNMTADQALEDVLPEITVDGDIAEGEDIDFHYTSIGTVPGDYLVTVAYDTTLAKNYDINNDLALVRLVAGSGNSGDPNGSECKNRVGDAAEDGKYYYHDGEGMHTNITTVAPNSWGWWYVKDGVVDFSLTGLANNEWGWWYIENGKVNFYFTGLVYQFGYYWYVDYGMVKFDYTGPAVNEWGTWYVKNGYVDFSFTGTANGINFVKGMAQ